MKTLVFISVLFLIPASVAYPGWIDTARQAAEKELEPVISDIGAAISGGLYQNAETLGFPGVSLNLGVAGAHVSDDNKIINEDFLPVPFLTASAGLPFGADLFIRGFSYDVADAGTSISILGGGLKYGILEDRMISPVPGVSAIFSYHRFDTSGFTVNTTSLGVLASKNLPLITPYAGISYDITRSKIDAQLGNLRPSAENFRIGGGVEFSPLPVLLVNASASLTDGNLGWYAGAGARLTLPF